MWLEQLSNLVLANPTLFPDLNLHVQSFFRVAYGALLAGTLILALPNARRFFGSEQWKGYSQRNLETSVLQNPVSVFLIVSVWLACAGLLMMGRWTIPAATLNLIFSHYFFIRMRWKSLARGHGAPGFMTFWMAAAVLALEYTTAYAPGLRNLALLVLQIDFAIIMLSAGIYKMTSGYPKNHGMELGMVNPMWGYWTKFYASLPLNHWIFKTLNHLAWLTEVVAAVLMFIPQTRFIGGLMIAASFAFVATHIRLGLLTEMVVLCCALFFHPGSLGDVVLGLGTWGAAGITAGGFVGQDQLNRVLEAALWVYLILRPISLAALYYNFYARKTLPKLFQKALESYTNFFGIILWRVFTVDVTNFFIEISHHPKDRADQRSTISKYSNLSDLRFNHVVESIAVTTIFTALKYFSNSWEVFSERLSRYAKTLDAPTGHGFSFRYVAIVKENGRVAYRPAAEYFFDPETGQITETVLDRSISVRKPPEVSVMHQCAKPGTYAPASP